MARLAQSEIDAYRDQGYLLLRQVIEPEEVAAARTLVTELVDDRARELKDEGKTSSLFEEESFERRLARIHEETDVKSGLWDLTRKLDDPELFRLVCYPVILDVLESLIGPEIGWTSSYVSRPKLMNEDVEKRGAPVMLPMKPGDMLLFTNLTYHKSGINATDAVRWSVDLRYVAPPDSRSLTEEERAGYDTLAERYATPPVTVRSRQPEEVANVSQMRHFIARRNDRRQRR